MDEIIDVRDRKQLFIDDRWFASRQGMALTANPPVKAERVIIPERPWESLRIGASGNTVLEDDGVYKMWYIADTVGEDIYARRSFCYAVSSDGIQWERENVDLIEWKGSKQNNVVMVGVHGGVMIDPNGPDEHRYKALLRVTENDLWPGSRGAVFTRKFGDNGKNWSELYLCTSPDGIHWRRQEPSALPAVLLTGYIVTC